MHPVRAIRSVGWLPLVLIAAVSASAAADDRTPAPGAPALSGPVPIVDGTRADSTDVLLSRARAELARGDTAAALETLEAATDHAPRHTEALYQRGRLLTRTTALGFNDAPRQVLAWRLLNRGAELAPRDARFVLELARLRLRTPLLRADAERLLRKALAVARATADSTMVAETASELAGVFERRYRTTRRRHVYIANIFFDPYAARNRVHYVREFLEHQIRPIEQAGGADRAEADRLYRLALSVVPSHAASAVGLLGLLYDGERFPEMRAVAAPFLTRGYATTRSEPRAADADVPPAAALASIAFADGLAAVRLRALSDAKGAFDAGMTRLPPAERQELLDIGRLLRRGDSVRVAGLPAAAREVTVRAFWENADPLLSTPENEAQLEYFARVAISMLRYDDPEQGVRGWRTDRGLIVIRYGEPPVEVLLPPANDISLRDVTGRVITVFYYPALELPFVFAGAPAMNAAAFAGDFRDVADQRRHDEPFRLDNMASEIRVDSMSVQVARFRGRTDREYHVLTAAAARPAAYYQQVELDRGVLAIRAFRGSPDRLRLVDSQQLSIALPATRAVEYQRLDTLPAGDHRVRIEVVDPAVHSASARANVPLSLPPPRDSGLALSDILLGTPVSANGRHLGTLIDAGIRPLFGTRIAPRDTFALYLEAYGLHPDNEGAVQIEVAIRVTLLEISRGGAAIERWLGNVADAVGLTPEGDQQLAMRFTRTERLARPDRVPLLTTIGMGTAPSGRYRLDVLLRDLRGERRVQVSREFTIAAAPEK
ncbi:MAG: GWxTD domain-containing protein [Gemmatimonadota bacterium]|nr:GWxTD domain-containing protein [Gemmatimonadota bacterium]